MSDNFDLTDFDTGRRDPRRYMRNLKKDICEVERGYHAALRTRTAGLLAMVYAARNDYELFDEWRQAECFEGDTKLMSLTEDSFQQHVARCVVKLGCDGSNILSSTRSKTLILVKFLLAEDVKPENCAKFIKAEGGFEKSYQKAKEERARRRDQKTTLKHSLRDDLSAGTNDEMVRKRASKAAVKPKEHREAGSMRAVGVSPGSAQLEIKLWKNQFEDFDGDQEDGEIRLLKVCWGKRGPTSPMSWSLMEYEILSEEVFDDDRE